MSERNDPEGFTFTSPRAEANFRSAVTAVRNASGASDAQARHVVTAISAYVARCVADSHDLAEVADGDALLG